MRLLVRLLAALTGLLVAVGGAVLAVSVAWSTVWPDGALARFWAPTRAWLESHSWASTPIRLIAGGLVLAGLVLLFLALRASRKDIALHDPAPEVVVVTDPRSLARVVGHQVRAEGDVASASVTATRSRIQVKATSRFREADDLRERLTESVQHSVARIPMQATPRVSVSVSSAKEDNR